MQFQNIEASIGSFSLLVWVVQCFGRQSRRQGATWTSPPPVDSSVSPLFSAAEKAEEDLFPAFYCELRDIAERCFRSERQDHTLEPTALVHEVFLRIADAKGGSSELNWKDRAHFLAWAAKCMRRILVDHARARNTQKRGGERQRVPLDSITPVYEERAVDLDRLETALEELETQDPELAQLVEVRFFGGLTVPETAEVLGVSRATAERRWSFARAWLHRRIAEQTSPSDKA